MGVIRRIALLIVFLLSLFVVSAATEDFQYTASASIDVCACKAFVIEGRLINTGDINSHYFISDKGSASSWTQIIPTYMTVSPSDSSTINTFVDVPCNALGEYWLYTTISTSMGLDKLHASKINVKKCEILDVIPINSRDSICLDAAAIYHFNLKNYDGFTEVVIPSVRSLKDDAQFNLEEYILEPGEEKEVYLYVTPTEVGEYDIIVDFTAKKSGYIYSTAVALDAEDCSAEEHSVTEEKKGQFDLVALFPIFLMGFYWLLGIFLLLLLVVFIFLLIKALKKRKRDRSLKRWLQPEEMAKEKEKYA
jgi:hypothetical protein